MSKSQIHIISVDKLIYAILDRFNSSLRKMDLSVNENEIMESCLDDKFFMELRALNRKINKLYDLVKLTQDRYEVRETQKKIKGYVTERTSLIRIVFEEKVKANTMQFTQKPSLVIQFYYDLEQIATTLILDRMELNVIADIRRPPSGLLDYPIGSEKLYGVKYSAVVEAIQESAYYKDIVRYATEIMGHDTWFAWGIYKLNGMYLLENYGDYRILEWYTDHWEDGKYVPRKG